MRHRALLATVGARVRALRERRRLSRKQLSERSGLSERFLAQLEAGLANISLSRFADLAEALNLSPVDLLAGTAPTGRQPVVSLIGIKGAGKSAVGSRLARLRGVDFVDLDHRIEEIAGLPLADLLQIHGEAYYRKLENELLAQLSSENRPLVLAVGGSIVNHADNFALLKSSSRTVWLRVGAQESWERLTGRSSDRSGERPAHAMSELRALVAAREALYATANFVVDTGGLAVDEIVEHVAEAIGDGTSEAAGESDTDRAPVAPGSK